MTNETREALKILKELMAENKRLKNELALLKQDTENLRKEIQKFRVLPFEKRFKE